MTEVGADRRILVEHERRQNVRSDLQGTSEPINRNSHTIERFVRGLGAVGVNEIAHSSTAVEGPLPYGATLIPYGIWNQFDGEGTLPTIPDSAEAIDEAIDTFWPGKY